MSNRHDTHSIYSMSPRSEISSPRKRKTPNKKKDPAPLSRDPALAGAKGEFIKNLNIARLTDFI